MGNSSGEGFAYGDHQLDAVKATFLLLRRSLRFQMGDELCQEGLGLAVTNHETEELAPAISVDARGPQRFPGIDGRESLGCPWNSTETRIVGRKLPASKLGLCSARSPTRVVWVRSRLPLRLPLR
jgi:hypothetical protein